MFAWSEKSTTVEKTMRSSKETGKKTAKIPVLQGATWGARLLVVGAIVGALTFALYGPLAERPDAPAAVRTGVSVPAPHAAAPNTSPAPRSSSSSLWARLTSVLPEAIRTQSTGGAKVANTPAGTVEPVSAPSIASLASEAARQRRARDEQDPMVAKVAPDLRGVDPNAKLDVIVQFKQGVDENATATIRAEGGKEKAQLQLIHAVRYNVRGGAIQLLAANPNVTYITPNRQVRAADKDYVADSKAVMAPLVWQSGWTGQGIGIAVIDSGIAVSADLNDLQSGTSRVVYSESFKSDSATTTDEYGHGTHVAGIVAGNGSMSVSGSYYRDYRGVAPYAQIVNLAVLGADGSGRDSDLILAIDRAIALKAQFNIRVINLSLGRQVFESYTVDPLCLAVQRAWEAGIVVVAAAGNQGRHSASGTHGYGTIASPGNSPHVITVGAMNTRKTASRSDDKIATYSSKGPTRFDLVAKPDLVAPGDMIVSLSVPGSTLDNARPWRRVGPSYFKMSGTSMAAPMVSGAVALLLQKDPNLTPDQVKARLMKTAFKTFPSSTSHTVQQTGVTYTNQYDIFTVGAGYVDISAAIASEDVADGTALSPSVYFDANTGRCSLIYADGVVWGNGVVWGTGVVWGNGVVWGEAVVWGANGREVNGTAVIWGNGVVWGESSSGSFGVIWGNGVVWGESTAASGQALSTELLDEDPPDDPPLT